jgi:hypothetical protein
MHNQSRLKGSAMKQGKHIILGVHITDRLREAVTVQKCLTEYGRYIKTRLGLHEVQAAGEGPNGILLLEMVGPEKKSRELVDKLGAIKGIEVQSMTFGHPA